ncbi:MAG: hypothetical protein ABR600_08245 [Actinomycetota bacterium]
MRSHRSPTGRRAWSLAILTLALLVIPQVAMAQVFIDPTATPEKHDGGWIYWMAQASIAMGALIVVVAGASYLRFAPRFYRSDREEEAKKTAVPAPPPTAVRIQYQPPPQPVTPPAQASAPAAPAEATQATGAPAPTPAATPVEAPAQAAPAAAPAAVPAAAPATAPAAPRHEGPVELDQETFDRVLQEQLAKGTDRRVAEGRARSAAVKAAREKAAG